MSRSPQKPSTWLILLAAPVGTLAITAFLSLGLQAIAPEKSLSGNTWRNVVIASLLTSISAGGISYWADRKSGSQGDRYTKLIDQIADEVLADSAAVIAQERTAFLSSSTVPAVVTEVAQPTSVNSVKQEEIFSDRSAGVNPGTVSNGSIFDHQPEASWMEEDAWNLEGGGDRASGSNEPVSVFDSAFQL